ncbi:amidase [Azospirillum picis]|uniref:Aspartyl-tRNA(Asn)/glutamyl-tRNA(Gln) amidotransferase subunit A n=1 Tax=Azospirillum picis TaxID=488438 RepID=A0ABU0MRC4_9PROT|nr:amidase [Azospirillum picis]MBP2302190.1 aspartyl-tRNA(Asn)/glutamyl-tRNA(Gln) amidotransferase subunit A [Azospirillum picis]MDQ0535769.1 aspartyl-tRNA(Asn)/glutamyl-tRNA(Gln) amidotransferase subunit A [Azospirillum picis]
MVPSTAPPQIPSADRLEAALARIADPQRQGSLVFTDVYAEEARAAAAASDRRRAAGRPLGPLDGRIVSVKALFDVAGDVTAAGSAILAGRPAATADARAVARLRAAGAVIVGRTHMTEFAFSAVGINPHLGNPGNPRDRARVPGGSSSGAVISVVDGMAEIALGSDTGGSLRIPAALSGAVGFKPSSGRLPAAGAFPLSPTLDVVGPIAATVADAACLDLALADGDPAPLLPLPVAGQSFLVPRGRLFEGVEPAVSAAFESALDRLRAAGAQVVDGSLEEELEALADLDRIGVFTAIELAATLAELGIAGLDGIDPKTRARIEAGGRAPAADYVRMQHRRAGLIRRMDERLTRHPVLLLPTVPVTAPAIAEVLEDAAFHRVNMALLRNPRVANLLDLPAVSLPVPADGLPVGLMAVGRRGSDRVLLGIAAGLERALAG